ncbi:hypothetical protein [Streptomyces sp. NRRL S-646]|uniref:hypothetical protein n=1 Tax=Streptomyces sp. NRRL S-646 TaxID=1463917 RepID=UPI0013319B78|nr:hypothetical protein [Streptomyces sp. NRRL S-646]
MAPELSERFLDELPNSSVVLDPMMGSGSFPLAAAARGHLALGCDSDPLAVLISQTAAGEFDERSLREACDSIVATAKGGGEFLASSDAETLRFIDFWFDPETRDKLAAIASGISQSPPSLQAPLWCAFSRLIITKDAGASRARDVSHSRPHRVREAASFDVLERFPESVKTVIRRSHQSPASSIYGPGKFIPFRADGRQIPLGERQVDAVMTSPPYLVAIDYLRGHRLSLVWMGYTIGYLRGLRSDNIGSQCGSSASEEVDRVRQLALSGALAEREIRLLNRYIADILRLVSEISRVLRPGGLATFVIADARLKGASVSVEKIITEVSGYVGLGLVDRLCREIPANRRYLPPPSSGSGSMDMRMREEIILRFAG